jgi:hypothetical protein
MRANLRLVFGRDNETVRCKLMMAGSRKCVIFFPKIAHFNKNVTATQSICQRDSPQADCPKTGKASFLSQLHYIHTGNCSVTVFQSSLIDAKNGHGYAYLGD